MTDQLNAQEKSLRFKIMQTSTILNFGKWWRGKLTPRLYPLYEAMGPLFIALATALLFTRLDQATEVLYGLIGQPANIISEANIPSVREYIGVRTVAFGFSALAFGFAVWYSARLLVIVDADIRTPQTLQAGRPFTKLLEAREHVPRLLGAVASALLVGALISAQQSHMRDTDFGHLLAWGASFSSLIISIFIQHYRPTRRIKFLCIVALICAPWYLVIGSIPSRINWTVISCLVLFSYIPATIYVVTVKRRQLLRNLHFSIPVASAPLQFSAVVLRLCVLAIGGGLGLIMLAFGPVNFSREVGSAAIVVFFLTNVLCWLCSSNLVLRRVARFTPGLILIGCLASLVGYSFLHARIGWSPFKEVPGREKLIAADEQPPGLIPLQHSANQDIMVNAYGGGLRSALFTAQSLAELDDISCGEFGQHLNRLSGVSGGSLGIAVYLTMRQEFIAGGGWSSQCKPSRINPRKLGQMIDDVLVQDHLSPVLARMLTHDLIPGLTPNRGEALLESWQGSIQTVLASYKKQRPTEPISLIGLARPLNSLSGGLSPPPTVYFNTTNSDSGLRFWFSNQTANSDNIQVGQAVLHSARFPAVSPAGAYNIDGKEQKLVDGGYADNSGVATLINVYVKDSHLHWLNIDGNPSGDSCPSLNSPKERSIWSGLNALLELRAAQSIVAVKSLRETAGEDVPLVIDLDKAFQSTIPDEKYRCEFIHRLRSAPLGWYMTPNTAGDLNVSIVFATNNACTALPNLCGDKANGRH